MLKLSPVQLERARSRTIMESTRKPNILVIWGDDIGISNLSCYSDGVMGYRTPNIDRIAREGMKFTDSYGEQFREFPPRQKAASFTIDRAPEKMQMAA
jgi:arylsulfatase